MSLAWTVQNVYYDIHQSRRVGCAKFSPGIAAIVSAFIYRSVVYIPKDIFPCVYVLILRKEAFYLVYIVWLSPIFLR